MFARRGRREGERLYRLDAVRAAGEEDVELLVFGEDRSDGRSSFGREETDQIFRSKIDGQKMTTGLAGEVLHLMLGERERDRSSAFERSPTC